MKIVQKAKNRQKKRKLPGEGSLRQCYFNSETRDFAIQDLGFSVKSRGKLYEKVGVVGLSFCVVRRLVSYNRAASFAPVDYDKSLFGVGKRLNRAKNSSAIVCSVTGVYINV